MNMNMMNQGGSPNGPPPPFYYHQPYAPVPPQMQYMQYTAPPPPTRPPRHERRASGGKTPSPLPSPTQNMHPKAYQMPVPTVPFKEPVVSSIPPLQDIFSSDSSSLPPQQQQPPPPSGGGGGGTSNYGSISSNSNANTANAAKHRVYNAPPRSNSSSNSNSNANNKVQPVLVRTNSSENITQLSTNKKKFGSSHRRANSDTPLRLHRPRMGSADLPPKGGGGGGGSHRRTASGASRGRSYSANSLQPATTSSSIKRPGHRRMDSAGSVQTYNSAMSQASVVSNISKSAMFGGVDEGGRVQLHFPLEAVRLRFQSEEENEAQKGWKEKEQQQQWSAQQQQQQHQLPPLTRGHLYQYRNAADYDKFEEYIRITDDLEQGMAPQWENLGILSNVVGLGGSGGHKKACNCTCNNCNGCLGKRELLPDANYALPVGDGVYKRVLGEIADAQTMPCGLFFCGHHEDVAYPSIQIAVVIVTIVFVALAYAAVATDLWN
mmetsp:Transcript_116291/g.173744  ORF Transcript_116291/g.173744 Transcript_116291/m.173744 type:complete len:491 (-) Transcript_116291:21-1493(-)